ncbi:MAG: hypothetical protein CVV03_04280 [Firmicutes bacterium HGW-Firmicutes-8]|nr:MAG: hypothetical protein CVV03_04280 [Firmicutes bacterium HGW-Firmicutes-8]
MQKRLISTFLIHLFGISLLLIPNRFQGPVVAIVSGVSFRVVDAISIILLVSATVFLYTSLILCLRAQLKLVKQCKCPEGDEVEKTD